MLYETNQIIIERIIQYMSFLDCRSALSASKMKLVIKVGEGKSLSYYVIDYGERLGKGSFGEVYKAHKYDLDTNTLDKEHPFAAKIFKKEVNKEEDLKREVKILRQYYKTEPLQKIGDEWLVITEYVPGENLQNEKTRSKLEELTFFQRVNLINQLVLGVDRLHQTTFTRSAIIHGDFKPSNVGLEIDIKRGSTDISIFDFGLSFFPKNNSHSPEQSEGKKTIGNAVYFPVETLGAYFGIKTDIYMLVNLISVILGEERPWKLKSAIPDTFPRCRAKTKYFLDNLIEFPTILSNFDLKKATIAFLNRMQSNKYDERPDSDEVLRFFTTLNLYCKTLEKTSEKHSEKRAGDQVGNLTKTINGYGDTLNNLLSDETYKKMLRNKDLKSEDDKEDEEDEKEREKTFKKFDFNKHISLCKDIIKSLGTGFSKYKQYLDTFLNRMESKKDNERPNRQKVLLFFKTLELYCKTFGENTEKHTEEQIKNHTESLPIYAAKLAILSSGYWNKNVGFENLGKVEEGENEELKSKKRKKTNTVKDYKFEDNIDVCKEIISWFQKVNLNANNKSHHVIELKKVSLYINIIFKKPSTSNPIEFLKGFFIDRKSKDVKRKCKNMVKQLMDIIYSEPTLSRHMPSFVNEPKKNEVWSRAVENLIRRLERVYYSLDDKGRKEAGSFKLKENIIRSVEAQFGTNISEKKSSWISRSFKNVIRYLEKQAHAIIPKRISSWVSRSTNKKLYLTRKQRKLLLKLKLVNEVAKDKAQEKCFEGSQFEAKANSFSLNSSKGGIPGTFKKSSAKDARKWFNDYLRTTMWKCIQDIGEPEDNTKQTPQGTGTSETGAKKSVNPLDLLRIETNKKMLNCIHSHYYHELNKEILKCIAKASKLFPKPKTDDAENHSKETDNVIDNKPKTDDAEKHSKEIHNAIDNLKQAKNCSQRFRRLNTLTGKINSAVAARTGLLNKFLDWCGFSPISKLKKQVNKLSQAYMTKGTHLAVDAIMKYKVKGSSTKKTLELFIKWSKNSLNDVVKSQKTTVVSQLKSQSKKKGNFTTLFKQVNNRKNDCLLKEVVKDYVKQAMRLVRG